LPPSDRDSPERFVAAWSHWVRNKIATPQEARRPRPYAHTPFALSYGPTARHETVVSVATRHAIPTAFPNRE